MLQRVAHRPPFGSQTHRLARPRCGSQQPAHIGSARRGAIGRHPKSRRSRWTVSAGNPAARTPNISGNRSDDIGRNRRASHEVSPPRAPEHCEAVLGPPPGDRQGEGANSRERARTLHLQPADQAPRHPRAVRNDGDALTSRLRLDDRTSHIMSGPSRLVGAPSPGWMGRYRTRK